MGFLHILVQFEVQKFYRLIFYNVICVACNFTTLAKNSTRILFPWEIVPWRRIKWILAWDVCDIVSPREAVFSMTSLSYYVTRVFLLVHPSVVDDVTLTFILWNKDYLIKLCTHVLRHIPHFFLSLITSSSSNVLVLLFCTLYCFTEIYVKHVNVFGYRVTEK